MKHRTLVIIAAVLFGMGTASAQYNETNNLFYHSFRTPQSNQLNPALYPNKNTVYLTLPSLGFRFGAPLSLSDFVYYDQASGNTVVSINRIIDSLTTDNRFRLGYDMDIVGFGLHIGNTFVTLGARWVNDFSMGIPIDIVNALRNGNVDDNGQVINSVRLLNGDLLNFTSYLETSIGVGHRLSPLGLTIGVRAKLLSGVVNLQTDNSRIDLNTGDNLDSISIDAYYQLQGAICMPVDSLKHFTLSSIGVGDIIRAFGSNTGVAFDLGAQYDFGPFKFSASINDLSAGIHWKKNTYTVMPEGGHTTFTFDGENVRTILDHGTMNSDSVTAHLQDFLEGLTPDTTTGADYWYCVPTKLNLGASFSFAKILRAGLLLHGQWDRGLLSRKNKYELDLTGDLKNTFRFNTTLTFGVNLFNWAELIVGSSIVYDGNKISPFNPGVGFVMTPATAVQVFVMADYVSSVYLVEAKAFNVKFGMNLLFGKGGATSIIEN